MDKVPIQLRHPNLRSRIVVPDIALVLSGASSKRQLLKKRCIHVTAYAKTRKAAEISSFREDTGLEKRLVIVIQGDELSGEL